MMPAAPVNRRVGPPKIPAGLRGPSASAEDEGASGRRSDGTTPRRPSSETWRRIWAGARVAVSAALVAGASIALAWVARRHILTSERFAIGTFELSGNERRGQAELVAESGLSLGSNIFGADLDAARTRLLSDPWVVEATLARRLPSTIVVHVVERRAAALVVLDATYLATAEGVPFKPLEPGDPVDLPVITGVTADQFSADRAGAARTISRAIDLAAEFDRSPLAKRAPLQEVHVAPDGGVTLVVGKSAMQVVLGGPPFRRKLDEAFRIASELDRRGGRADAILLDNDLRPERVVVRMR